MKYLVHYNAPPRGELTVPTVEFRYFDDEKQAELFAARNRWGNEPSTVLSRDSVSGEAGIGHHYEMHRRASSLLSGYLASFRALFPDESRAIKNIERALDSARNTGD